MPSMKARTISLSAPLASGSSNGRFKKANDGDKHAPTLDNVPDTSSLLQEDVSLDAAEDEEQGVKRRAYGSNGA